MAPTAPVVYVVRHGITDWNMAMRFQGAQDIPINAQGRAQADSNGLLLRQELGASASTFDFVASPLSRTRETMERVRAAMGLEAKEYRTDDRLIEVCFGDWEGSTIEELSRSEPDRFRERSEDKWNFQPPGASSESYEILSWRVAAWFKEIQRPTVCVSHGGVIRSLFRRIAGMSGEDAAELIIPQDRVLKIEGRHMHWLPADQ
ncbi:histidine phosphatase family protein [Hoeflea prorocentri]|uniref:Phosphoglycerate mutase family protein n=1 Tax=Hoeflea prorocentri TaxID=1922333 RepID=A0A9X3ZI61_9HYPH|nr:histidine phosphatase family protein [Hoeflea prorocentri]MCY6381673.1 phosphoglycerate mutase family protein [Hoeflea prorocentri]MDA5399473.1 phosphoglycerate mutase family protein [Hoeflea prorocentri]